MDPECREPHDGLWSAISVDAKRKPETPEEKIEDSLTPKCPKCSAELRDDYGMVTCPKCAAIVFVDMEGLAHVASDAPVVEETPPVSPAPYEEMASDIASGMDFPPLAFPDTTPETAKESSPEPLTETAPELPTDSEPFVEEPSNVGDMDAFLGYGGPESGDPKSVPPSQTDPNDPLGLSAYANSEMSSALGGPLVVSLIISGIDAKDLRDEIRQALQDSRFGWDAGVLMSKMNGGVLRIERISPVKATVIINRIKNLSVRIRWEQNAITEIDPVEKDP